MQKDKAPNDNKRGSVASQSNMITMQNRISKNIIGKPNNEDVGSFSVPRHSLSGMQLCSSLDSGGIN